MAVIYNDDMGITLKPAFIIGAIQINNTVYVHCDALREAHNELTLKCSSTDKAKELLRQIDDLINDDCVISKPKTPAITIDDLEKIKEQCSLAIETLGKKIKKIDADIKLTIGGYEDLKVIDVSVSGAVVDLDKVKENVEQVLPGWTVNNVQLEGYRTVNELDEIIKNEH